MGYDSVDTLWWMCPLDFSARGAGDLSNPGPKVQKYSASETPARSSEDLRKGQNVINGLEVRFFAI